MNVKLTEGLIENLKRDEGFRSEVYVDTTGHDTIGYGTKLPLNDLESSCLPEGQDIREDGVNKEQAECMLKKELRQKARDTRREFEHIWDELNQPRKDVLINMAYNLGVYGLTRFKKMIGALERGDYEAAADEMLDSQWHDQTKRRAERLARQMRMGTRIDYR